MKKYRCSKCGETFEGEMKVCPKCGVELHYRRKEEVKKVEEAKIVQKFNFDDPDIIKHDEKIPETPLIEEEDKKDVPMAVTKPMTKDEIVPNGESFYDGGYFGFVGWFLLAFLLFVVTLTFGFSWSVCMMIRYETKHTVVQGHRLAFDGKGIQLFGRIMLWLLLFILTLSIFGLWIPTYYKKWKTKHIIFGDTDKK